MGHSACNARGNQPLVLIEWHDSHAVYGWHTGDPSEEPLLCRSVGWLMHDGEKAKTIAAHMTNEETPQRSGEMTTPSATIIRVEVLK